MVTRVTSNSFFQPPQRQISVSQKNLAGSLQKLSSGLQINKAADNAAGLAIASQMEAELAGLRQASSNVGAGQNMLNVAEGGLSSIGDMLGRARELAVQSANGTLSQDARNALSAEYNNIMQEIDRITGTTEFNGQKLLNGEMAPGSPNQVNIQAGANAGPENQISMNVISQTDTATLGIANTDISTQSGASNALSSLDTAIATVSQNRSEIGAVQNRLNSTESNLGVSIENISAAKSSIMDLDYANETGNFTRNQLLSQISTSMLKSATNAQGGVIGSLLNIKA